MLARGKEHEVFDRAVDVQVSRLRKLVEPDAGKPRYIQTVWGGLCVRAGLTHRDEQAGRDAAQPVLADGGAAAGGAHHCRAGDGAAVPAGSRRADRAQFFRGQDRTDRGVA